MPARPVVRNHILTYFAADGELHAIPLDTPEWETWLENRVSFSYDYYRGWFTARREVRHHQYIYLRIGQPEARPVKLRNPSRSANLQLVKKVTRH